MHDIVEFGGRVSVCLFFSTAWPGSDPIFKPLRSAPVPGIGGAGSPKIWMLALESGSAKSPRHRILSIRMEPVCLLWASKSILSFVDDTKCFWKTEKMSPVLERNVCGTLVPNTEQHNDSADDHSSNGSQHHRQGPGAAVGPR
jgi:hypothetical protein